MPRKERIRKMKRITVVFVAALVVGVIVAWVSGNLFLVASSACAVVFLVELLAVRGPML